MDVSETVWYDLSLKDCASHNAPSFAGVTPYLVHRCTACSTRSLSLLGTSKLKSENVCRIDEELATAAMLQCWDEAREAEIKHSRLK